MALQGTLETFTVPDVLRLLSTTKKSGLFELEGDRGVGRVWLTDGALVAAASDRERTEIDAALFDLLRFAEGSFRFEPDASAPDELSGQETDGDVEAALGRAEVLLDEWREIESVIPSLDSWVRLVPEIAGDVTIAPVQWATLAVIGSGSTGRRVGDDLELGELDACRRLRELVDLGVAEVDPDYEPAPVAPAAFDAPPPPPPPPSGYDDEPVLVDHDLSTDEVASLGANLAGFVAQPTEPEPFVDDATEQVDETTDAPVFDDGVSFDAPFEADDPAAAIAAEWDATNGVTPEEGVDEDSDEFLSQLANLSPKAAKAIEAIDGADHGEPAYDTLAEPAPAATAEPAGDEELNKNLLLKFLSSAKN